MKRRLARTAEGLSTAITWFEKIALSGGILSIAALTIGNVIARTLLDRSLFFAEELSQFLIVMVTFLGLGYAAGKGRHIRMTAFYDALPLAWRKRVMLFVTSTTALLLFFLAYLAFDYAWGTVRALDAVSPVLRVPKWLVYLAAPVGFLLGALQYTLAFVKNVLAPEVYLSFDVLDEHAVEPGMD